MANINRMAFETALRMLKLRERYVIRDRKLVLDFPERTVTFHFEGDRVFRVEDGKEDEVRFQNAGEIYKYLEELASNSGV